MQLTEKGLPSDAMFLLDAIGEFGHSREFFKNHCHFYSKNGRTYVSRQEAEKAHSQYTEVVVKPPEKYQD